MANLHLQIDYFSVKDDFSRWLKIQGINWEHHAKKMLRYLERFAKPICKPMDLVLMFEGLGDSQKRHLTNALRKLFNFYEAQDLAPKQYTPQGIRLLREIYDKANLRILIQRKSKR